MGDKLAIYGDTRKKFTYLIRYAIIKIMRRVVIDTDVVVTALRSITGGSNAVLTQVAHGRLMPLVTPALFLEYETVLKRPEQRLVHGLDLAAVDRFLSAFAAASEAVEVSFHWRPQLRDANDEMVLETALNGQADALVTHNVKDFASAAEKFGLRVLRPGELLKELRT
jgi:putative PIN family toxin of toxin-antitoxin system